MLTAEGTACAEDDMLTAEDTEFAEGDMKWGRHHPLDSAGPISRC